MSSENNKLGGHTIKSLRKHYSIVPLYGLMGLAVSLAVYMGFRTLTKNPDVMLDHHRHTRPWDDYRDKQYKLIGPSDVHSSAPKF